MAGTTTNFAWSYPTGGDVANVASDEQTTYSAIDATLGNAWTSYTPAWTSTGGTQPVLGNGSAIGFYKQYGKWGIATGQITMGTTTTFGTGEYRFSLPPGWTLNRSTLALRGIAEITDTAPTLTFYLGVVVYVSSTLIRFQTHLATNAVNVTTPFTFATGDTIAWEMVTEIT